METPPMGVPEVVSVTEVGWPGTMVKHDAASTVTVMVEAAMKKILENVR